MRPSLTFYFGIWLKNWFGLHGFSVSYPPILIRELTLVCGIIPAIYVQADLLFN